MESDAIMGEEEGAVDVSLGGHITKQVACSRSVSQELMDSSGPHVSHHFYHVFLCLPTEMWSSPYFTLSLPQNQSAGLLHLVSPFPLHAPAPHPHLYHLWHPPDLGSK